MRQKEGVMVVHNLCIQMSWWTLESLQEPEKLGCLRGDWYVEGVDVRKREEVQMVRLMAGLGQLGNGEMQGIKLQLRPEWVEGEKLQMIWGVAPADKPRLTTQVANKLPYGVNIEWKGEQRLLQTGKPDLLVTEKEKWRQTGRAAGAAGGYRQERVDTDPRKLVIKPLAKHLQGQMWADKLQELIEGCEGVEGVESVGFSPDRHPGFRMRGVVAFVVFHTVEQRDAALVDNRVIWALLGTEFQLENRQITIEAKDPERNTALDRKEAEQVGGGKRPRKEVTALPKPLGRTVADGAQGRGRGGGTAGVWESRPTIADEHGKAMDRGGEEAIREMEKLANDQLVEQLGRQMKELFSGLALKQEEENRRLREENLAIRKQMVELEKEKVYQNGRMEQLMTALLKQMGGNQPCQGQPASPERTPAKGSRAAVVVPVMPGTQEKQARPGVLAQQGGAGSNVTQEWMANNSLSPAQHLGSTSVIRRWLN